MAELAVQTFPVGDGFIDDHSHDAAGSDGGDGWSAPGESWVTDSQGPADDPPVVPPPANPIDVVATDDDDGRSVVSFTMPPAPVSECQVRRAMFAFPLDHTAGLLIEPAQFGTGGVRIVSDETASNGATHFYAVFCRNGTAWNDTLDSSPPDVNADTGTPQAPARVVRFDAASEYAESNANSELNFQHNVGTGTYRLLIVGLTFGESGWQPTPNVRFAGRLMTLAARTESNNTSAAMWYLVAPPSGAGTVAITDLSTYGDDKVAGAVSFSGVDPDQPLGPVATNFGVGADPTVVVSSAEGQLVVDVASTYRGSGLSPAAGQSVVWNHVASSRIGAASTRPGGGLVTMSWVGTLVENWAIVSVAIRP